MRLANQDKSALRDGPVEAGRIQAGLPGMIGQRASCVLPIGDQRANRCMQGGHQHQTKGKSPHSQSKPLQARVVLRMHADYALYYWTII